MMKTLLTLISLLLCCAASAQEVLESKIETVEEEKTASMPDDTYSAGTTRSYQPENFSLPVSRWEHQDSLHLPTLGYDGRVLPLAAYPFYPYGWSSWSLHEGLNVSLGASVFAQFGKHARHGAGFAQNLSAMYAMPLSKDRKWSLALGGFVNNVYWNHSSAREAGLSAVLGYQFDEHWEAFLYGQKSLVSSPGVPYPLYDMGALGDRIGAAVRYNVSPSFSVEVSVEHSSMPHRDSFHETYMQMPPSGRR